VGGMWLTTCKHGLDFKNEDGALKM
jgi:hypothetical protein